MGAGNMARALGGGLAGRDEFALVATDPVAEAIAAFREATGGAAADDVASLLAQSDVVIVAVKPQVLPEVLASMKPHVDGRHLVVSIVAGGPGRTFTRALFAGVRVVRAMPNTPALVGEGMTVLVGGGSADRADRETAEEIFSAVGRAVTVDDEHMLDAVTAVSGSGPGFLFAYAEAMLQAADEVGLPADLARMLVQQTILGSARLWLQSAEGVDVLRERVTSPGGTTQAGLEALGAHGFGAAIGAAVEAASRRSRELSGG